MSGGVYCFVPELELTYVQLQNTSNAPNYLYVLALCLLFDKDPEESIPYFKRRKHYKNLVGTYKAYKDILVAEITEKNGLLYLREKDEELIEPLIPKTNDPEVMQFFIINEFGKLDISFNKLDNNIIFEYERNIMVKKTYQNVEFQ